MSTFWTSMAAYLSHLQRYPEEEYPFLSHIVRIETIYRPTANDKTNNGNTTILHRQRNPKLSMQVPVRSRPSSSTAGRSRKSVKLQSVWCHADTLQKLRHAIKARRRPGMLSDQIVLPFTYYQSGEAQAIGWETLQQHQYGSDLSTCDVHIFSGPKRDIDCGLLL